MGKGVNIIKSNCDLSSAEDTTLPRDCYLVTYGNDGKEQMDIVQGLQVDIFNEYYDKYKDFRGISWTKGLANPKMWNNQSKSDSNKKK